MNDKMRLAATCRRLKFIVAYKFGILWMIDHIYFLDIKEPYKTMYKIENRKSIKNIL